MLDRRYRVEVKNEGQTYTVMADAEETILHLCRRKGFAMEADCNGMGTCGKCKVRVLHGKSWVTEEDRRLLTPQELESGYRLACRLRVRGELTVSLCAFKPHGIQTPELAGCQAGEAVDHISEEHCQETNLHKSACFSDSETKVAEKLRQQEAFKDKVPLQPFQIAVDLGSTTLAAALLDESGRVYRQLTAVNSQRMYGADVLSRIQAANEGLGQELKACICKDLKALFAQLSAGNAVRRIAIAGNTAMLHLLCGYSCAGLGQAPFTPVTLGMEHKSFGELFGELHGFSDCEVTLLPGMSAFVGADIVAGLYSSGFYETAPGQTALFLDLGTNGELAIGNREQVYTASTAAGPAFEGGRLSCGVPGIPGAIAKVSFLYHRVRVQTIGQKKPCGICGTGALEAAAALLKEGLMDETGLLAEELRGHGLELARREDGSSIRLTQSDIRELQLAKAAIRAGIDTLQSRYGQEHPQGLPVSSVYLAGGFGYFLATEVGVATGLFPPEWEGRVVSCGNTSLKGAIGYLSNPTAAAAVMEQLRGANRDVALAGDKVFEGYYMKSINFKDCQ